MVHTICDTSFNCLTIPPLIQTSPPLLECTPSTLPMGLHCVFATGLPTVPRSKRFCVLFAKGSSPFTVLRLRPLSNRPRPDYRDLAPFIGLLPVFFPPTSSFTPGLLYSLDPVRSLKSKVGFLHPNLSHRNQVRDRCDK